MSVLEFDKNRLGNLEYSLRREILSTDRAGGYMSTTIVCCNTRKYHGLFVCPAIEEDEHEYVMLSSLDETVLQHDQPFNLAIHHYPGAYEPKGHKYLIDFRYTPMPTLTYRVGGVILKKELLWIHSRPHLLIRYTLVEATSPTTLRLRPFLAFRDKHTVGKANLYADGRSYPVRGGVRNRLYERFPWLYLQTDAQETEFVPAPDWYYNFEYDEERDRGYDYLEDLLTTGYFEMPLTKDRPVVFSCSLEEFGDPTRLNDLFEEEAAHRTRKDDMLSCLRHSARQFVVSRGDDTDIIAGYPWFGSWGRDTFISLPGITLTQGGTESCIKVIDTLVGRMAGGLFPNIGTAYNSVDAPLWFFWTLQRLAEHTGEEKIWLSYGDTMKNILESYRRGIGDAIRVNAEGLVCAGTEGLAMTWMDAVVDGIPVTGREGYQVEVNALWYNAVCYTLHLADKFDDRDFTLRWQAWPERISGAFAEMFWYEEEGYLTDYVSPDGERNTFVRPNQIIACSLDYKIPTEAQRIAIIDTVRNHLLTSRGLRTLSPRNPQYQGHYGGDQPTRDRQYHQGTVWVWLLEHYVRACFDIKGHRFLKEAEELLEGFEEDLSSYGIGSVPEIYDGDPPHAQRGAVSQAWSVGALLEIDALIKHYRRRHTER